LSLLGGLSLWYFVYGLELFINGGDPSLLSRPRYVWEELGWVLPGGHWRRLAHCDNDVEQARTLPGLLHFIGMHLVLPFGPAAVVWYIWF
jgi:hypothetical protein